MILPDSSPVRGPSWRGVENSLYLGQPMNFFDAASDLFTRPLDPSLTSACADARALVELLNVDSYTKMGHLSPEQASQLHLLENRLQTALARPADARQRGTVGGG